MKSKKIITVSAVLSLLMLIYISFNKPSSIGQLYGDIWENTISSLLLGGIFFISVMMLVYIVLPMLIGASRKTNREETARLLPPFIAVAITIVLLSASIATFDSGYVQTNTSGNYSNSPYDSFIYWDEAHGHVGEYVTIEGDVVSTNYSQGSEGQPTFLNIGEDYPDNNRVTIVIWGGDRENFSEEPEYLYDQRAIRVSGYLQEYGGALQIEVSAPDQIEVMY